ncbi:MAG: RNA-binding protein [Deltaproteobacteria bacterium RIFOXYD12_FULL_50_9]|nr:MAG: RNA-binding protein [Deltaproteobacteria bacterium RIFOXYD12_FULL_50_9]
MDDEKDVRIDKWLWAARFFKTRSIAAQAVTGGKVHGNGVRVKPSRNVQLGDILTIRCGDWQYVVAVRGISSRRGPAAEARKLYEETAESVNTRERQREDRRLLGPGPIAPSGRPSKRDRRLIRSFTGKEE